MENFLLSIGVIFLVGLSSLLILAKRKKPTPLRQRYSPPRKNKKNI